MEYSKEYLAMQAASKQPRRVAKRVLVVGNTAISSEVVKLFTEKLDGKRMRISLGLPERPPAPTVAGIGKKVRHVFIEATFPELKGGEMYQHAHGEAAGNKAAISRAFKNLLKTIPKKRISVIKATISITTKIVEDKNV